MTVDDEEVTVILLSVTMTEEGEEDEFTGLMLSIVISNQTYYSVNPNVSTTSPEEA